jgi:hydroxymethylpyrimidine/phosphomethylpyrimidine kinase
MPESGPPSGRSPVALTIAGSDSSGGAGIQADIRTFHHFEVFGASVVTAVTAQNTTGVGTIHPIPPEIVIEQYTQVTALAGAFKEYPPPNLVVDPVMIASSGRRLLDPTGLEAMIELIFPAAILVTPNLNETAAILESDPVDTIDRMGDAAASIQRLGPRSVLVKGGHLPEGEDAVDILYADSRIEEFRSSRTEGVEMHGTGCILSAAITAGLAMGRSLPESISTAKEFISESIRNA